MRKKIIFVYLLQLLLLNVIFSQVTLQTGAAEYSIPIFNYTDNNSGLNAGISLNYSSGNGLKISEVASCLGTGWALGAGGFIQRIQIGEPDDQHTPPIFQPSPNCNVIGWNEQIALEADENSSESLYIDQYYPNGFLYSEFDPIDPNEYTISNPLTHSYCNVPRELALSPRFKSGMAKGWKQSRRALADREQDIYVFSFNGRYGQFVIGRDRSITVMPDSKLKVEIIDEADMTPINIRTRIGGFIITDEMGTKYTFSDFDKAEVAKENVVSESSHLVVTETAGMGKYVISKWNLSSISSLTAHGSISYKYEDETVWLQNNYSSNYEKIDGDEGSVGIFHDLSTSIIKRLKSIVFSDSKTKVEFIYGENNRYDLKGSAAMSDILLKYNNVVTKSFHLETKYFVKKELKNHDEVTLEEENFARLALVSVQEKGSEENVKKPAYTFNYYTGSESGDDLDMVPPQFTFAQDMYGFYNKSAAASIVPSNPAPYISQLETIHTNQREINDGAAIFGLLKSVQMPEGGILTYEYGQNKCLKNRGSHENISVGGVRVEKTRLNDDISESTDIVTSYSYTNSEGMSTMWGYELPNNIDVRTLRYMNPAPGYDYSEAGKQSLELIGNMGLKLIKPIALRYISNLFFHSGVKVFNGADFIKQAQLYFLTHFIIPAVITLLDPYSEHSLYTYSFYPVWSHNPLPMQYSSVTTTMAEGQTGKIVYQFSTPNNVSDIPQLNFPYSNKPRVQFWEYGLPIKTQFLNSEGNLVKEIVNSYNIRLGTNANDANNRSVKILPSRIYSARCEYFTYTIPVSDFGYDFYTPVTGSSQLESTDEITYRAGTDNKIIKRTEYKYNSNNFQLSKITTGESDGTFKETRIYYPQDYREESVPQIHEMLQRSMYNVPVSTEEWHFVKDKWEMTGCEVVEFGELSNGDYKPKKIHSLLSNSPVSKDQIGAFDNSQLVRNTTIIPLSVSIGYNSVSDPVNTKDVFSNRVACQLFDNINHLPVAEVINSEADKVAYTSFESEETGWTLEDAQIFNMADNLNNASYKSFTGTNIASGTEYRITSPPITLGNSTPYKLSFWIFNPDSYPNGYISDIMDVKIVTPNLSIVPYTTGPKNHGWKYYEYNLTMPSGTNSIAIHGKGKIDEIRLYPANARMKTVSYYPPNGKISECDENNHVRYYQYNSLGQLIMISDENMHALKTYEYHYKYAQ